jgi:acyl-CoA synthetase (AMP-forming)/AMP-acid ligase II
MDHWMQDTPTIVHALARFAQERAQCEALLELDDTGASTDALTYQDLAARVSTVAAAVEESVPKGAPVVLVFPKGLDLTLALLGCLAAGRVPVPAPVPRPNKGVGLLMRIVMDSGSSFVATTPEIISAYGSLVPAPLRLLALPTRQATGPLGLEPDKVDPVGVAYLQYTSGSTLAPRGVVVAHDNLCSTIGDLTRASRWTEESPRTVCWLPLFHDLGLVGLVLATLWNGGICALLSPIDFLRRPRLWLEAMTSLRGTLSAAPDFAYRLCIDRVPPTDLEGLDLSSWRLAVNAAEPLWPQTLERFAQRFAPVGFDFRAFVPCYGLAESTLAVTGGPADDPPVIVEVDAEALEEGRFQLGSARLKSKRLVGCGPTSTSSCEVRIVDPETRKDLGVDAVGEIWVRGPSVARGYFGNNELTAEVFLAELSGQSDQFYLRTGDLGALHDGQLFVVGRLKDLIIVSGRNHCPQDIEQTVGSCHNALHPAACCAFAASTDKGEQLVVWAEWPRGEALPPPRDELLRLARAAVQREHGLSLLHFELLAPGELPRTTSGKLQRRKCAQRFQRRLESRGESI